LTARNIRKSQWQESGVAQAALTRRALQCSTEKDFRDQSRASLILADQGIATAVDVRWNLLTAH